METIEALSLHNHSDCITIQIDKLGRVVIPQSVRARLNLAPGKRLTLALQTDESIVLKVVDEPPQITMHDGIAVISGTGTQLTNTDPVELSRSERLARIVNPGL